MAVVLVAETPHELIVLKPAGLPCEMPRDPGADSLTRRLGAAGFHDLRLVHRLDAAACGLVLVARSSEAAAHHSAEIAARRWRKRYVARVSAPPALAAGLVGRHKAYLKTIGSRATVVRAGGKPSFLEVLTTSPTPDSGHSHVLVALHTGRFHQIRAMLADLGAPLCGDLRYGGPPESAVYLEHVTLGARRFDGEWTVWSAPSHRDRDRWSVAMTRAVEVAAAAATAT